MKNLKVLPLLEIIRGIFTKNNMIRFVFENILSDDNLKNAMEKSKILHKETRYTVEILVKFSFYRR